MIYCSVVNCQNSFLNNPARVSFHKFPNDRDILHYWINFTGIPNFVPKPNSHICSAHFEDDAYLRNSNKLKSEAYPTIFVTRRNVSFESEELHERDSHKIESNGSKNSPQPFSLNPNTVVKKITFNKDGFKSDDTSHSFEVSNSNRIMNMVSSQTNCPSYGLAESNNTIVLNYNQNTFGTAAECFVPLQIKVPVNILRMHIPNAHGFGQNRLTSVPFSSSSSYKQPITHMQSQIPQKGPIKVVDMKKLLQPPKEDERTTSTTSSNEQDCQIVKHVIHNTEKMPSKPHVNNKNKLQTECTSSSTKNVVASSSSNGTSKVAVSQVLDCLKVILPLKFDLSRLVPNDKVAALVIRYLKLEDDSVTKSSVIMYLRIIVDAARIKEKSAGSLIKHPYLKINDIALQLALEKVLPPKFTMSDVSNLILNCLCIVLNQDVYTDGYHILRRLIRMTINDGQYCNEIPKQVSNKKNRLNEKVTCNEQKEERMLKKIKLSVTETHANRMKKVSSEGISSSNISVMESETLKSEIPIDESLSIGNTSVGCTSFLKSINKLKYPTKKWSWKTRETEDKDWELESTSRNQNQIKKKTEIEGPEGIQAVTSYIETKQCSAKDVLSSFRNMFYLCRFLGVKSSQSNIQKLNGTLSLIAQMNDNGKCSRLNEGKIEPKPRSTIQKESWEQTHMKLSIKDHRINKLKLKPVVVLRDLIDYTVEDMLFMKCNKVHRAYYNQRVPHCFQNNISSKKYSSDHVHKETTESYKMFRRIVVKKIGEKVVYRIKYSKLAPGSLVFVKDFRNPSLGWLKGSINKIVDSLKYVVQLGSGEIWWCAPEQLRPLPHIEIKEPNFNPSPRSPRVIKPRQLFDL